VDDDDDDMPMMPRVFIRRLDELIKEARKRGVSNQAIADALENVAGAVRQGLS
jgi:hypothetical protein